MATLAGVKISLHHDRCQSLAYSSCNWRKLCSIGRRRWLLLQVLLESVYHKKSDLSSLSVCICKICSKSNYMLLKDAEYHSWLSIKFNKERFSAVELTNWLDLWLIAQQLVERNRTKNLPQIVKFGLSEKNTEVEKKSSSWFWQISWFT